MDIAASTLPLPEVIPDEEWFQPNPAVTLQAAQVARELDYDEIIAARLVMLGKDAQEITDYLNPAPQHITSPEETVSGMTAAAHDLAEGIKNNEPVAIYADYDVDGQTSLAILTATLEEYGAKLYTGSADATTGFGLTRAFVEEAYAAGCAWLITVDCGSTQSEPVRLARSLGMKVIIIDHHDVDVDNTADHHLNPRLKAALALQIICQAVVDTPCRQKLPFIGPYLEQFRKLTERSEDILREHLGSDYFDELRDAIYDNSNPTNTGSMLTWKFAAAFHLQHHSLLPAHHWGRPLYLGGLGAIADLAPCDNQEVRAFVRVSTNTAMQRTEFNNLELAPLGLTMLAEALGENVLRPDQLVRTRALVNLPKRTSQIRPEDIQTILLSDDESELNKLIPQLLADYERLSVIRREEMDMAALEQVAEAEMQGEITYFAYAILDGFPEYAGYTRMVANTLCKETGKPSVVFAYKGEDEFGQRLYKFSGANDVLPDCHLGDLIHNPDLQEACLVRMHDWLGEEAEIINLGGHTAVVSGVVTHDNIENAKKAFEAWAAKNDERGNWRPIERKRPRIQQRKLSPQRLRRLERESELLYPLSFPEAPSPQVSICGIFTNLHPDPELGTTLGDLLLSDQSTIPVKLSDEIAALARTYPDTPFEAVIALGRPGGYYVSTVAKID